MGTSIFDDDNCDRNVGQEEQLAQRRSARLLLQLNQYLGRAADIVPSRGRKSLSRLSCILSEFEHTSEEQTYSLPS